mmetsp:Transcript_8383/g.34021  ORF Transcript_8383/g.34021 Transcript_8383/m.34021 type:complete len:215 (+) Transcript_8383:52-696(+)
MHRGAFGRSAHVGPSLPGHEAPPPWEARWAPGRGCGCAPTPAASSRRRAHARGSSALRVCARRRRPLRWPPLRPRSCCSARGPSHPRCSRTPPESSPPRDAADRTRARPTRPGRPRPRLCEGDHLRAAAPSSPRKRRDTLPGGRRPQTLAGRHHRRLQPVAHPRAVVAHVPLDERERGCGTARAAAHHLAAARAVRSDAPLGRRREHLGAHERR